MAEAKKGDTVKVHYTGKLDDGSVFDSSEGRDPIEFTIGERQVIPGFEDAVVGMNIGEKKNVRIASENAYGERHEDAIFEMDRSALPKEFKPEVGKRLDWENRKLCSDGNCIGVIGSDGRCKECGKPFAG